MTITYYDSCYRLAELDFKTLNPCILHCLEGAKTPTDDACALQACEDSKAMRKLIKRFLLMIVNAKNPASTKGELRQAFRKDMRKAQRHCISPIRTSLPCQCMILS